MIKWKNVSLSLLMIFFVACKVERNVYNGNTVIKTKNAINKEVGLQLSELARKRAEEFLCLAPKSYNIIIIDTLKAENRVPKYDNAIVFPWIFKRERFIENGNATFDEKIAFYTRFDGPNSPLPHELGHALWEKFIISERKKSNLKQYGTMAPDWIDEAVAILFEDDMSKEMRRVQFFDSLNSGYKFDLGQTLDAIHPTFLSQNDNVKNQIKMETAPLTSTEKGLDYNEDILFYLRSLVLADYLIETSGNSCIFAEIGEAIASHQTFDEWLANQTEIKSIHSRANLDTAFQGWIKETASQYPTLEQWISENLTPTFETDRP